MAETQEQKQERQGETRVSPTTYAIGQVTKLMIIVGTLVTIGYMAAFKFLGDKHHDKLIMPYKGWVAVKEAINKGVKHIPWLGKREFIQNWHVEGMPGPGDGKAAFIVSSFVGFMVGKIISLPQYFKEKHHAEAINQRVMKKDETIAIQNSEIADLRAKLEAGSGKSFSERAVETSGAARTK